MTWLRFVELTNKTLRSLWVGEHLGHFELGCLLSLVEAGNAVGLYVYSKPANCPSEIQILDANEILHEREVFHTASSPGTFSGFSNLFRYRMLQVSESIWVDTDVLSAPAGIPEEPYLFGWESSEFINGAVLSAPQSSGFLSTLVAQVRSKDTKELKWGEIGPKLITKTATSMGLENYAKPREVFYPLAYNEVWKLFSESHSDSLEHRFAGSSTVHLWNEVLRKASRPVKKGFPHPKSYLGKRFVQLGLDPSGHEIINPEWAETTWRLEQNRWYSGVKRFLRKG